MKIERFKHWFQIKNADGNTVAQFLTEQEALVFIGSSSSLPCADLKLGDEPVNQRRGYTTRRINIYP